nr:restriction endonuclease subunit S [uncultured Capnocytophaga sp.]
MNKNWIIIKVRELLKDFERGISYSSENINNEGIPMINLACIDKKGYYREGELKYYTGIFSEEDKIYSGDLLIACTDLTRDAEIIGTPIEVPLSSDFFLYTMDLAKINIKEELVFKDFIVYALKTKRYRKYIKSWATGTNVLHLNLRGVYDYPLYMPRSLSEQKRISSIFSIINRKIALNKAINHNLEAMAKQLYDYWFVQFDFPNQDGKPYKSSGGKMVWNEKLKREIPEGWNAKRIDEITIVYNGATPSTTEEDNYGGDIIWITPKDLSSQQQKFIYQGERNISQKGYDSCSTHILPINSILMSSRAPIGLLAITKTELCTNQGFKNFVPKEDYFSTYLYYYLLSHIRQIEQLGTGTTFKEVSREDISAFLILFPLEETLRQWEKIIYSIDNKQLSIQKQMETLTKQRDELLPLLMNGQVTVG